MPSTDIARKSIVVLLAGSAAYYMTKQYLHRNQPFKAPAEKMFHAETDTTPVPTPNEDQPGDMENDQLRSS